MSRTVLNARSACVAKIQGKTSCPCMLQYRCIADNIASARKPLPASEAGTVTGLAHFAADSHR